MSDVVAETDGWVLTVVKCETFVNPMSVAAKLVESFGVSESLV